MARHSLEPSPPISCGAPGEAAAGQCRWKHSSAALAWMTERTKEKIRKRNADRRNWYSAVASATAAPWIAKAHIYRRSTAASRPEESFIARDSASGQASWDVAGTRFAHPFERALPAPACP